MKIKFTFVLGIVVAFGHLYGSTVSWYGKIDDAMLNPENWDLMNRPVLPGQNDEATFGVPINNWSVSPRLTNGQMTVQSFLFDSTWYTFTIDPGSSLNFNTQGIINSGTGLQTFNVNGETNPIKPKGKLTFSNSASADGTKSKKVVIDVTDSGLVQFNDYSTASYAQINLRNLDTAFFPPEAAFGGHSTADHALITGYPNKDPDPIYYGGQLSFYDQASAKDATINMNGSCVHFDDNATAGKSMIDITDSHVMFDEQSSAGQATINAVNSWVPFYKNSTAESAILNLNKSEVTFYDQAQAGNAKIKMENYSKCCLGTNLSIAYIESSDGSSEIDLQSYVLTLGTGPKDMKIAGPIVGTGSLQKVGESTLVLTGRNTYTGGTTVTGSGILEGTTSSLQGSITNQSNVVFNQKTTGVFNGTIIGKYGESRLTVKGGGKVYFNTDNSTCEGAAFVENSELAVNGSLGGMVFVFEGGTVSGTGTFDGVWNSGGRVVPGDGSMGTLTVTQDYLHDPAGVFAVQVNKAGQSSLLKVGSEACIWENKGKVEVTILDAALIGPQYTIIQTNEGFIGTFDQVVTNNPYYCPKLSYDDKNAYLSFQTNFHSFCQSPNQTSIARQIDSVTHAKDDHHAVIHALAQLPAAEMSKALDKLSGQQYANLFLIPELADRRLLYQLYYPARPGSYGCDCENPCCNELEVWSEFQGGRSFLGSNQHAEGLDFDTYGLTAGAQKYFSPCLLAGVAGAYEHDHISFDLGGSGRAHTFQGALYAAYNTECYYIFSDAVLGQTCFKLHRAARFGAVDHRTHCKPRIFHGALYTELGTSFAMDCLLVQPFAGMEAGFYRRDKFHEHGAGSFDLHVDRKIINILDSRLGFHVMANLPVCLMFNADLAWQHRYCTTGDRMEAHFAGLGQEFTVKGVTIGRNSIQGSINLARELTRNFTLFAEFNGERWDKFTTFDFGLGLIAIW